MCFSPLFQEEISDCIAHGPIIRVLTVVPRPIGRGASGSVLVSAVDAYPLA